MKHNIHICCDRLDLEPMSEEDSEKYRKLRNREENRCFFFDKEVITVEQQRDWYKRYCQSEDDRMFSIFEQGLFVGGIGIYNIDFAKEEAEIGRVIIDRKIASGKGYATEAIIGLSKVAFEMGIKRLFAIIYNDNIASIKSFLKAGFCYENVDDKIVTLSYSTCET